MKFFDVLQNGMEKILGPIAKKMNESKTIKALSSGMMATMPVSIGVAAICILVNLPIPGWIELLTKYGIYSVGNEIMTATISMLAIYLVVTVSYYYAQNEGENGLNAATITMGSFLLLIPQFLSAGDQVYSAMLSKYLGSNGIFVGMVLAILVSKAYCYLSKKNIKLTLPDSVPSNVSDSLSPIFIAMIIFTVTGIIKYVCTLTPYGNIFDLINTFITMPIMSLGASPVSLILVYTFASVMWFFGVHPSPIMSMYGTVMISAMTYNRDAFSSGDPLPYLAFQIVYLCVYLSGTGNTIGLAIAMQKAKSERYKSMKAITLVPNIFNINEPLIFGVPVMLNVVMFIPMILATVVPGVIGLLATKIFTFNINPTISMPWVTPTFINAFLMGGIPYLLLILVCIVVTVVIWYPFFKILDDQAYKEEQEKLQQVSGGKD